MGDITIREVAGSAGVSETTVSLAFRENSRISDKTRQRVLNVARKLNYTPNLAAQNLRNGVTNSVAFIVNDICNPFYSMMFKEAENCAREHSFNMIFGSSDWLPEKERQMINQVLQMRVRGVIICFCEKAPENLEILRRAKIPYIAVDSYPDWYDGAFVANDFEAAGKIAAEHLLEQGCKNPVYFNAGNEMKEFSAFKKMQKAFASTIRAAGLNFTKDNVVGAGLDIQSGKNAFIRSVRDGKVFDAVFCANDLCALGVCEGMKRSGKKGIAIMGIDDIEVAAFEGISLTSLRQPYAKIARLATENLMESIKLNKAAVLNQEFAPELIFRKSTLKKKGKIK